MARVRNALRVYQYYEHSINGKYYTWTKMREAIAGYTGVEIGNSVRHGGERLRLFVDGIEDKGSPGGRKFPRPKNAALDAIIAFVTHEDHNLLTKDEFKEHRPGFQASLRLLEYLKQKYDPNHIISPEMLEGLYQTQETDEDDLIVRNLTMQRSSQNGLVQVIETEDVYDQEVNPLFKAHSPWEHRAKRISSCKYGGWAILTPEQNLLFFMKEERTGMNRYYFTLFSDMTRKMDKPMNRLILMQHDYPFESEINSEQNMDDIIKELKEEFSNNLLAFERC